MQSRKLVGVVISAMLIVAMVLIFTDPWSTIRHEDKRISLTNSPDISKIILTGIHDSTWLIREGEQWLLFGREEVNPVAVENLLFAAERLQITSFETGDSSATSVPGESITYLRGERIVRSYTIRNSDGHYLARPAGSERSFHVSVPGYPDLNLDRVFSSSANHFRKHLLIDLLPSEISLIEVELANGHAFRFTQDMNGEITCSPTNAKTVMPSGSPDDLSIRLLFSYFTSIRFESKSGISLGAFSESERENKRIARLSVVSAEGEEYNLEIFPFHAGPDAEAHRFKALVLYNRDPEALVVNYIYLDVLMRDLSHYYKEKQLQID